MIEQMLSVEDVAGITGLAPGTIRAAVREGELIASRLRRRIRIHPADLAGWLDANRIEPDVDITPAPAAMGPRLRTPPPAGGYRAAARARRAA